MGAKNCHLGGEIHGLLLPAPCSRFGSITAATVAQSSRGPRKWASNFPDVPQTSLRTKFLNFMKLAAFCSPLALSYSTVLEKIFKN
jgi:hypothetical protein